MDLFLLWHPACRQAGTVHLGNTLEEIVAAEQLTAEGKHPEKPFVLLAQQSLFDPLRAPEGKHTAWAYCHVPNGSEIDMTERIEKQVERFAPHFRDRIIGRHVMNTAQMEAYNPNYIGGDINGGMHRYQTIIHPPGLAVIAVQNFCKRNLYLFFFYTSRWRRSWYVRISCREESLKGCFSQAFIICCQQKSNRSRNFP